RNTAVNRQRVLNAIAATTFAIPTGAGQTITMTVTGYGWPDNSPSGTAIAYPQVQQEAGGTGTYADPITFATDPNELAVGTVIYVRHVKRYFINQDFCGQCATD